MSVGARNGTLSLVVWTGAETSWAWYRAGLKVSGSETLKPGFAVVFGTGITPQPVPKAVSERLVAPLVQGSVANPKPKLLSPNFNVSRWAAIFCYVLSRPQLDFAIVLIKLASPGSLTLIDYCFCELLA